MQIFCAYSGLRYSIPEHFNRTSLLGCEVHPVFALSAPDLCYIYEQWARRELSKEETYLLALALLHSTGLIEFRQAAQYEPHSTTQQSVLATQMQQLLAVTQLLSACPYPQFVAPRIVISDDTANLSSLPQWVRIWRDAYDSFSAGMQEQAELEALRKKEQALYKFIHSPAIPEHRYAHVLADWAAMAASFPPEYSSYWKECIIKCYEAQSALVIPPVHLEDIQEWLESNLDEYSCGSVFSYKLFALLSAVQDCRAEFELLPTAQNTEAVATINAAIASAPTTEPQRSQYNTTLEYLKAKSAYILAQSQSQDYTGA